MGHHLKKDPNHKVLKQEDALIENQELNLTLKASRKYKSQVKNLSDYDKLSKKAKLIFLTGLFDGEGSFGYHSHGKSRRQFQLSVGMVDEDLIKRFKHFFRCGFTYFEKERENRQRIYRWKVTGAKAFQVLNMMINYLCLRRKEKYKNVVKRFQNCCPSWYTHI